MRFLRFILWIIALILLIIGLILISGNGHLLKGSWATYFHGTNTATIDDARFFDLRKVSATAPEAWSVSQQYNTDSLTDRLANTLSETSTVAFLVIKKDSIRYEKYWNGYNRSSLSNSHSMAKSIVSLLVQLAIQEGYIGSWDDPVIKYLPRLEGPFRDELKLRHLSKMTAGLDWDEHYTDPFDITARAYYGSDIEKTMYEGVHVTEEPGLVYEYQSGAPQLLGFVLERATNMTVSEYASKSLWKPLGAEHDAQWHLDSKKGKELTFCCFSSTARDFARFGKLLINHGYWDGMSVIDSTFVHNATHAGAIDYYGWSFWVLHDFPEPVYYMFGYLGQYIIVVPNRDLVIVRIGKAVQEQVDHHNGDLRAIVEEVTKSF